MKRCWLCGSEFEKLCKAHIIPDFMYRELGLFNDKHRVQTLRMENGKVIQGHRPTGVYDTEILCKSCDGDVIGAYEDYARNALFSLEPTDLVVERQHNDKGDRSFLIKNLDYTKFKLFLLSLLWRSSVSGNEFFAKVKLPESDEERIRNMIRNGDAGAQLEYPCTVWTHVKLDLPKDYILSPISQSKDNFSAYYFPIGGNVFIFMLGQVEGISGIRDLVMNEQGTTRWPEFKSEQQVEQMIGFKIS